MISDAALLMGVMYFFASTVLVPFVARECPVLRRQRRAASRPAKPPSRP